MVKVIKIISLNFLALISILIISIIGLEIFLRLGFFREESLDKPSYIPRDLKKKDELINKSGYSDIDGFRSVDGHNKINYLISKQNSGCNIVILGASYIWGSGLKPGFRWPDKLNNKLNNCEIHSFGANGWSSLDKFQFYQSRLKHLKFDHLIIGYVTNDPDLEILNANSYFHLAANQSKIYDNWNQKDKLVIGRASLFGFSTDNPLRCGNELCNVLKIIKKATAPSRLFVQIARKFDLKSIDFLYQKSSYLFQNIFTAPYYLGNNKENSNQVLTIGYSSWQRYLYKNENFSEWQDALATFSKNSYHPTTFVLTAISTKYKDDPTNNEINKVSKSMMDFGINFVNCTFYYDGIRPRSEWANPADAHPGINETEYFANCSKSYLNKIGFR